DLEADADWYLNNLNTVFNNDPEVREFVLKPYFTYIWFSPGA
ncbi:unnamed protein product, partial [marine sediment metagenome]